MVQTREGTSTGDDASKSKADTVAAGKENVDPVFTGT